MRDYQYLFSNNTLKSGGDFDRLFDKFIIGKTQHSGEPHHTLCSNKPTQPTHSAAQTEAVKHTVGYLHITTETSGEMKLGGKREVSGETLPLLSTSLQVVFYLTDIPSFVSQKVCFGRLHNHVILLSSLPFETKEAASRATDR